MALVMFIGEPVHGTERQTIAFVWELDPRVITDYYTAFRQKKAAPGA
jgi:hypothetical protein